MREQLLVAILSRKIRYSWRLFFTACISSELIRVASVSMRSYGQLAYSRASQGTLGGADRSTLKGKRDYVIIALLVGCAPRRA